MHRRLVSGLLGLLLLVGLGLPAASTASAPGPAFVLVHGAGSSTAPALEGLNSLRLPVIQRMDGIGVVVSAGTPSQLRQLGALPGIERVEPAPGPMHFDLATSRRAIRMDDAATIKTAGPQGFAVPYDGTGIGIAVVDMGIDPSHPMFRLPDGKSSVVRNLEFACVDWYPILGNRDPCGTAGFEGNTTFVDATGPAGDTDGPLGGHGTHVSSTAAGQRVTTLDGRTLQGIASGARLIGLGVTSEAGFSWAGIAALNWIVENHRAPCGKGVPAAVCPPIRVVNNSWGYPDAYDKNSALAKATRAVLNGGVAIAWSAGNKGEAPDKARTNSATHGPEEGLVSVASYDDSDRGGRGGYLSSFSSRGLRKEFATYPDISAPGSKITAACRPHFAICSTGADTRDPNYNTISGTSMASPHVAGAMAVLLQANPRLTPASLERILEASAYKFRSRGVYEPDPANPGTTTSYDKGHGLLDMAAALAMVTGKANPPVTQHPNAYRPPAPAGAARIGTGYEWKGGPLSGVNISGCGQGSRIGDCDLEGIRLDIPEGGADIEVTISPTGTPVGVELIGPDGSVAAGNYFVDTIGSKTIKATGFTPGVWTVAVFAEWGAVPTYSGLISLSTAIAAE